jgi:hypothetical protein
MPFLNSLAKNNLHGSLEVPLGYTSIIASFMTGMYPEKHGIFDLFKLASKPGMQVQTKYLLALIRLLQGKRFFYSPLEIPKSRAKFFQPSMEKTWAQKNCLPCRTIFDILEKNNRSFAVIDWPNYFINRKGRIFFPKSSDRVIGLIKKSGDLDFIFAHFLDLEAAHSYGTESKEIIKIAKNLDGKLAQLKDFHDEILFFSDHSMADIRKEIDIIPRLNNLNLEFGRDFIFLVGSTTVEFWFKNKEARAKVINLLKTIKDGKIVNIKEYRLPKTSDLLFLANVGTAFYPNFFSKKRFKAMHGWNPKQQKTVYVLKNKKSLKGGKDVKMVDFLPTILDLMKLPRMKCNGKSLIR